MSSPASKRGARASARVPWFALSTLAMLGCSAPGDRAPDAAQGRAAEAASARPAPIEAAHRRLAAVRAAARAGAADAARAELASVIETLLALPAEPPDDAALALFAEAAREATALSDPRAAARAWTAVLAGYEARPGTAREDVLRIQQALALALANSGELARARALQAPLLAERERELDARDPALLVLRTECAATLRALGDVRGARAMLERALDDAQGLDDRSLDVLQARSTLARTRAELGDLAGALPELEAVLAVLEEALEDDHPRVSAARQDLGVLLAGAGRLAEARGQFERALAARERTLAPGHPELLRSRMNLGGILQQLGDHERAHALFEACHAAMLEALPPDHPDLQRARVNLAVTRAARGDSPGAMELLEPAVAVLQRTLPAEHPLLLTARTNLASHREALGDHAGARAVLEDVLRVRERVLPEDHPELQASRCWLGALLLGLGDVHGARARFEQAVRALERTRPPEDRELQRARRLLAEALLALGRQADGESLAQDVVDVLERSLSEDDPDLAYAREVLATALYRAGEFARARELFDAVVERLGARFPPESRELTRARAALASALAAVGELDAARAHQEELLELRLRTVGAAHPDALSARRNLILTLASAPSGPADARVAAETRALVEALRGAVADALLAGSVREAEDRCAALASHVDVVLSTTVRRGNAAADAQDPALFELLESLRGAWFAASRLLRAWSSDEGAAALADRARAASADVARLARRGAPAEQLLAARSRREEAERELLSASAAAAEFPCASDAARPARLATRLAPDAAFVSFRDYVRYEYDPRHAPPWYAAESLVAFVLRADGALHRVELGPTAPIEAAVDALRAAILGSAPTLAARGRPVEAAAVGAAAQHGRKVSELVLDPLVEALAGARHLVVALDGPLQALPLGALPAGRWAGAEGDRADSLLGDVLRIDRVSTVLEVGRSARTTAPTGRALLVGGIEHASLGAGLGDLPAAGDELLALSRMPRGIELEVELLAGAAATRERFLERAPAADWIHVASHGWYDAGPAAERPGEPADVRSAPPAGVRLDPPLALVRSGLAFAGEGVADDSGALTAEELSTLDLSRCRLAVLSACETYVGSASRAGQGVASLQKALHMAGARAAITSLWRVPDAATKELMIDFYRRLWVDGEPAWKALSSAQSALRDARDAEGNPMYATRDWAAWVLTGETD